MGLNLFGDVAKNSINTDRLAIWLILQGRPSEFFCLMAVVCSSWVPTNAGTSRRCVAYAEGKVELPYIAAANCMVSRLLVESYVGIRLHV